MASVYALYSGSGDIYYKGNSKDTIQRLEYHQNKEFPKSFAAKYEDWELFFLSTDISISASKKIESHIKRLFNKRQSL